jgi:hypothetical protein
MTVALCFGRTDGGAADAHVAAGSTLPFWPRSSWLDAVAKDLRRAQPTEAGRRVLAKVGAGFAQLEQEHTGASALLEAARRRVAALLCDRKPLRLPTHRWLPFDGRIGLPKRPCLRCVTTMDVQWVHEVGPPDAEYYTLEPFTEYDCAETRLLLACLEFHAVEQRLSRDISLVPLPLTPTTIQF